MDLIIDSNQLQTERLRRFFQMSRQNRAVLTDMLGIEGYNGDPKNTFKWLAILAEFPDQVLLLKGSTEVMKLSGRPSGLLRRMIDDQGTQKFKLEHLRAVRAAQEGNGHVLNQVSDLRKFASEHLSVMESEATNILLAMETLGSIYTNAERAIIRKREPYTRAMIDKLTPNLFSIVSMMIGPNAKKRSFDHDIKNTLPFRVALAMYVLMLNRTAESNITAMKPRKLRNDFVDMIFVAYGTYFDGVLTADTRLKVIYDEVSILLFGLYDAFIVEGHDPFSDISL